jgi:hypothetical protein
MIPYMTVLCHRRLGMIASHCLEYSIRLNGACFYRFPCAIIMVIVLAHAVGIHRHTMALQNGFLVWRQISVFVRSGYCRFGCQK